MAFTMVTSVIAVNDGNYFPTIIQAIIILYNLIRVAAIGPMFSSLPLSLSLSPSHTQTHTHPCFHLSFSHTHTHKRFPFRPNFFHFFSHEFLFMEEQNLSVKRRNPLVVFSSKLGHYILNKATRKTKKS